MAEIGTSPVRGEFGLDLTAALAMSGALFLGESFAGIIIAMMFAGGEALEDFAQRRARHGLTALLDRVPRTAAHFTGKQFDANQASVPAVSEAALTARSVGLSHAP